MFIRADQAKAYTQAGSATLTLESIETGAHYTYRIDRATNKSTGAPSDRWFVNLMTGPSNEEDFTYIGMIARDLFILTKASKLPSDAKPVAGFLFFWRWIASGHMPPKMIVRHDSRCGRCHRKLTTPESIDTGLGPDCADTLGVPHQRNSAA